MKDRILYYLAAGLSAAETARLVGCSASYVSQLLQDDSFKKSLADKIKDAPVKEEDSIDTKYTSMEMTILHHMKEALPNAELPHLSQALREVSNAAERREKRRNPLLQQQSPTIQQVVQIAIPAHALAYRPVAQLNSSNEVVAIDNKPLAPMTNEKVKELFSAISERKKVQNVEQSEQNLQPKSLPSDF